MSNLFDYIKNRLAETEQDNDLWEKFGDLSEEGAKETSRHKIFLAETCAFQINHASSVHDFLKAYNDLKVLFRELIFLNEKKGVIYRSSINPKENWDQIKNNLPKTLLSFINRNVNDIPLIDETYIQKREDFISSITSSTEFMVLLSEEHKKRLAEIHSENLDKLESIQNRNKVFRERDLAGKLGDQPVTLTTFDNNPFPLIQIIEQKIDKLFNYCVQNGLSPEKSKEKFKRFKENLNMSNLPLMVEVRLESLFAEYEPKFSAPSSLYIIDSMDGHEFERWCASLLRRNGFSKVELTAGSGDQGVDIVAEKDGIYFAIQCKCYSSDLGNKPIQEVYAGKEMYRCQVAAVMTNRYFTSGAKDLAEKTRVLLWDRDKLKDLLGKEVDFDEVQNV